MSLSNAILTALLEEDLTGYALAKQFDVSLGFFWRASHQQIYQTLKKLHAEGSVEVEEIIQSGKPDKRRYSLTDAGRSELDQWVLSETKPRTGKDELFIKLYNIGYSDAGAIIDDIKKRQLKHKVHLELYRKIESRHYKHPAKLSPHRKGIYLALSAGIRTEQSFLDWCDEALALLSSC